MHARDFCFWLQGHIELNSGATPTDAQWDLIKRHLGLVFAHDIDPSMGSPSHQSKLDSIHHKLPPHLDPKIPNATFPGGERPRC